MPLDMPRKMDGLEVHQVTGQFVIYQPSDDAVHYLNPTAAVVLELCDGSLSITQIAEAIRDLYGLPAVPQEEVQRAIESLKQSGLVA